MNINNKNLALLFSAGAVVVILAVLVPVLQNRQELRNRAQGPDHPLPSSAYRNPFYPTSAVQGNVTVPVPSNGSAFTAPNDTIPPQLSITSPHSGTTVQPGSSIVITAIATDNTGITKVEFLANGVLLCTKTTTPYTCSWTVPNQPSTTYLIVVRAYDLTGNISSKSIVVRTR